ncbi:MAG: hypothetical protein ACK5LO_14170 [Leucobacter sp.]
MNALSDHQDSRNDTEIRLSYVFGGGVTGRFTEFKTDSSLLTDSEEEELRRLIAEADFFNVPKGEPSTVIMDGMTARLWIAVGRRNREVVRGDGIDVEDTDAFRALVAWVDERTPPLFPRVDADLS